MINYQKDDLTMFSKNRGVDLAFGRNNRLGSA